MYNLRQVAAWHAGHVFTFILKLIMQIFSLKQAEEFLKLSKLRY
jgi:hypothetical protein